MKILSFNQPHVVQLSLYDFLTFADHKKRNTEYYYMVALNEDLC